MTDDEVKDLAADILASAGTDVGGPDMSDTHRIADEHGCTVDEVKQSWQNAAELALTPSVFHDLLRSKQAMPDHKFWTLPNSCALEIVRIVADEGVYIEKAGEWL